MSPPLRNIRLTIQYDGTAYLGWQRQPQGPTIQAELERALKRMTGEEITLTGSGRTDAGVHALGQVANFRTSAGIPLQGFLKGLNSMLPDDIAITGVEEVPPGFHAIRDCIRKEYCYHLISSPLPQPLWKNRAWVVPGPLDPAAMEQAASLFLGTHDFSSFRASGSEARTSVRTVSLCKVEDLGSRPFPSTRARHLLVVVAADGFLRYMVRNMVGLLVEIGLGRRPAGCIPEVIAAADRSAAGPTAPAQGLYLVKVEYGPGGAIPEERSAPCLGTAQ